MCFSELLQGILSVLSIILTPFPILSPLTILFNALSEGKFVYQQRGT